MACSPLEETINFPLSLLFLSLNIIPLLLAVFGNSLVVYVILKKRELRTAHNLLVAGLAFNDLFTAVWTQAPSIALVTLEISTGYCTILTIIITTGIGTLFSGISILVMVSYERHRCASKDNVRQSSTILRSCVYLGVSWALGTVIALIFHFLPNAYTANIFAPYMVASVALICIFYWKISKKVKSREHAFRLHPPGSYSSHASSVAHSQRTYMRKVGLILCTMFLSMFPLFVVAIYQSIAKPDPKLTTEYYTWAGSFFYYNGAINPFIYGLMNYKIGMAMKKIFPSLLSCYGHGSCRHPHPNRVHSTEHNITQVGES